MAWAFCSGMAAETALFLTHGREGVVCIGDAYGGTLELLASQLPLLGITTQLILGNETGSARCLAGRRRQTGVLRDADQPDAGTARHPCHRRYRPCPRRRVAVDNTFASPVNQRPLELGADFVVHSATKYLGGHSDLTAGALMGSKDDLMPVWNWRKNLGSMIAPETASLLSRSLRTLVVRVRQQNATAQTVAEAMARHPKIARVYYPGLPGVSRSCSGVRADAWFRWHGQYRHRGFWGGGHPRRGPPAAVCPGAESGRCREPGDPTLYDHPPRADPGRTCQRRGISDAMLRLSVGLEDAADLIADLEQALE